MAIKLPNSPYASYAVQAATKAGVPPEIVLGLIQTENATWNEHAINHNPNGTNDYGLTQMNDKYYPDVYGMTGYQQIDKTVSILADNYKSKGNWFDAVAKYNGSGAVTIDYAKRVFSNAATFGLTGAPDAVTAANTGLPIDPSSVLGTGYTPGQTGTVTLPIDQAQQVLEDAGAQVEANNPDHGTAGAPPVPPTVGQSVASGIQGVLDNLLAKASAAIKTNGLNYALIGGAALFLLVTTFHMVGQAAPVVIKGK